MMINEGNSDAATQGSRSFGGPAGQGETRQLEVAILEIPASASQTALNGHSAERSRRLLRNLARELIQAETSTRVLCRREAKRLGNAPAAVPLLAAALHADKALRSVLPHAPDQPTVVVGSVSGTLMSAVRQAMMDYVLTGEQAYRGTLLELRHGIDLVHLLRSVALRAGDASLAAWCQEWLALRVPVVQEAEANLTWFADNLEAATETARPLLKRHHPRAA